VVVGPVETEANMFNNVCTQICQLMTRIDFQEWRRIQSKECSSGRYGTVDDTGISNIVSADLGIRSAI